MDASTTGAAPLDALTSTTPAVQGSSDTDIEMESDNKSAMVLDSSTGAASSLTPVDTASSTADAWRHANALPGGTAERALARRELVHGWPGVPTSRELTLS